MFVVAGHAGVHSDGFFLFDDFAFGDIAVALGAIDDGGVDFVREPDEAG
jgi:hypothetical protein